MKNFDLSNIDSVTFGGILLRAMDELPFASFAYKSQEKTRARISFFPYPKEEGRPLRDVTREEIERVLGTSCSVYG